MKISLKHKSVLITQKHNTQNIKKTKKYLFNSRNGKN